MVGITVMLVPLNAAFRLPIELAFDQVARDDVPTEVYRQYVETGKRPRAWSVPGEFDFFPRKLNPGDVVLFYDNDTIVQMATVQARSEGGLARRLWPYHDDASTLLFLSDVERIHVDVNRLQRQLSPLSFDSDRFAPLWFQSDAWGSRDEFYTAIDDLVGIVERRRLYGLVNSPSRPSLSRGMEPGTNLLESLLERFFGGFWGLGRLKIVGMFALVVAFLIGSLNELWCILGSLVLNETGVCSHVFNLAFVDNATTLSFSLTAFLLVGVTVVVAVQRQQTSPDLNVDVAELWLRTGLEGVNLNEWISVVEGSVERYTDGRQDGPEYVDWELQPRTNRLIFGRREPPEPDTIQPPDGNYEIVNARSMVDPDAPPANLAWRLQGEIRRPYERIEEIDWLVAGENRIDWWLVEDEDEEGTSQAFRARLGSALSYSVSASVLGILIQWYPWISGDTTAPWLSTLSLPVHVFYSVFSTFFALIFLGMIWTSIDLVELMARMREKE